MICIGNRYSVNHYGVNIVVFCLGGGGRHGGGHGGAPDPNQPPPGGLILKLLLTGEEIKYLFGAEEILLDQLKQQAATVFYFLIK